MPRQSGCYIRHAAQSDLQPRFERFTAAAGLVYGTKLPTIMSSPNVGKRPVKNFQFLNTTLHHLVSFLSILNNSIGLWIPNHFLDIQRALVLDYLCHNCHTETARAFAHDSAVRHLDADGDEIVPLGKGDREASDRIDEMLRLVEFRQREFSAITFLNSHRY